MDVGTFRKLFVIKDDAYGKQNKGKRTYKSIKEQLTNEKIQEHLDGKETIGIYQVKNGEIIWACIDIDIKKETWSQEGFDYSEWEDIVALQVANWKEVLLKHNIYGYYEESGNKGAHIWIFFNDPIPALPVKEALENLSSEVKLVDSSIDWELYPKSPNSDFGNLLKGPNGKHEASQKFSNFVDKINLSTIKYTKFEDIVTLSTAFDSIFNNCAAFNNLLNEGLKTGHLPHDERLHLAYVFGNLGESGKKYIKNKVFKNLLDWNEATTDKNLDRIDGKYKPCTCKGLQKKGICAEQCSLIGKSKSPIAFYYRALGTKEYQFRENLIDPENDLESISTSASSALDPLDKFFEKDSGYYKISNQGKKDECIWKIANFNIIVSEDLKIVDEFEINRIFKGYIKLDKESGGKEFPFEISAENWADPTQVKKMIYKSAGIGNAKFDNITEVLKCVDKQEAPKERISSKVIGYEEDGDDLKYYTKSVIISKDGIKENNERPIDFSREAAVELNSLDMKIISEQHFQKLTEHIKNDYLKLTNENVAISILATTMLPFLYRYIPIDNKFYLLIKGQSGLGKSFIVQASQRFYTQHKDVGQFLSWTSTPNYIQKAAFFYRDTLCFIDDFKNSILGNDLAKAINLLQSYADNAGRGRLRSDLSTNVTFYPRGVIIMTGEDKITTEASTAARGILIEYPPKESHNTKNGTNVQKNWKDYAGITPHLIYKSMQMAQKNPEFLSDDFYDLRDQFNTEISGSLNSSRMAQNFAVLATVVKNFVFPWLYGNENVGRKFYQYKLWLKEILKYNIESVSEESSAYIFWNSLLELLSSQKFRLQSGSRENPGESFEKGILIGYYMENQETIALNWGLVYDEISKHLRSTGNSFSHSKTTVLEELYNRKIVLDAKPTPRTMNGLKVRVVRIPTKFIKNDEN